MASALPLEGIRIIDLSMGWSGPLTCRHMADMGADVIKVESCERFDWWRSWEATPEWIASDGAEKTTAFNAVNRNKRGITLDLEHPEGRKLLLELVATANAVVENYTVGVLQKLGLDYDSLRAAKENIILLSMPAFGTTGPWAEFRAYGSTVEQASGLPHLNGTEEDPPTMQHVALGDAVGGLTGASALAVALRHQARTGEGQFVDLAQVESLFPLGVHGILEYTATGKPPARLGNAGTSQPVHGTYPCAGEDVWVVIDIETDSELEVFRAVLGISNDEPAAHGESDAEIDDDTIAAWTKTRDADEVVNVLQAARIRVAKTYLMADILNDPHLSARGFWQLSERAFVGVQPNASPAYRRMGEKPYLVHTPAPTMGQHNDEVLRDILNLGLDDLSRLTDLGIIGRKPRMRRTRDSTET